MPYEVAWVLAMGGLNVESLLQADSPSAASLEHSLALMSLRGYSV